MVFFKRAEKRGPGTVEETGDRLRDLHAAIKGDDAKLTERLLTADASLAAHSFGRFPLLSLCYMYDSRAIIRKFGKRLKAHEGSYAVSPEYPEDYKKFKELAGRSLRLFREGFVTPLDMLAVKGDAPALRAELGAKPSKERAERVAKIYELTSKRKVRVKENGISVPRSRSMTRLQKAAVVITAFFGLSVCALALGAYFAVPAAYGGDGSAVSPILISNAEQFVFAAGDDEQRYFKLTEDIVLDASDVAAFPLVADLNGDGHTVKVAGATAPLFTEISGKIHDVVFDFGEVNIEYSADSALLARTVTGTAENVTLKANGTIKDISGSETVYFGCLAVENKGTLNYVTCELSLTVTGASAGGESAGDSFFAGIVAKNSGSIAYCELTDGSSLLLDTVDGAGIVAENASVGRVLDSVNAASVTQTSSYAMWSPNTSGVVLNNYGSVNNCLNSGAVTVSSEATKEEVEAEMDKLGVSGNIAVYAGGVVCTNYGTVRHSKNTGNISAASLYSYIYAGGIAAANTAHSAGSAAIDNCASLGVLSMTSAEADNVGEGENVTVFLFGGGIAGYFANYDSYSATTTNSYSAMTFTHPGYSGCFAGGIAGVQLTSSIPVLPFGLTENYYLTGSLSGFNAGVGALISSWDHNIYYASGANVQGGAMPLTRTQLEQWSYYW